MTANFKYDSIANMDKLLELQPDRPILVSEFWPGWFDHWFEPIHNILSVKGKISKRKFILEGRQGTQETIEY